MDNPQPLTLFDDDLWIESKADLLAHYERVIERGLEVAIEVWLAMKAIRDGKLYQKQGYKTFEQYCEQRWEISRPRAYQLIDAADVIENLSTTVDILPTSERQIRPLTPLPPEEQREVWQEAVDTAPNGKVTAAHVEAIVERRTPSPKMAVHFSSDTPEHYTPKEIIEAVIACMGGIDLDPCSNSYTHPNVPAEFHYIQDDDGLSRHWAGRVYMNPPYGREIGKWVAKLCQEWSDGKVSEAIALVPARTDTDWFDQLIDGYRFHCFVHGRLCFVGNDANAPFPSAIVYLGDKPENFFHAFRSFGRIVQELHPEMVGA